MPTPMLIPILAACGGALTGEPHPVLAEVSPASVTIPAATYLATPGLASFNIANQGLSTLFATPASDLAEGDGADLLVFQKSGTPFTPYTPISPEQTIPLQATIDPRAWRYATGDYTVRFPFELRYFWQGQDITSGDPLRRDIDPIPKGVVSELEVNFSIDCDLDDDGYDAKACGGDDCDDQDDTLNPGIEELCNAIDDDCDGAIDEFAVNRSTFYPDDDRDGFGDDTAPRMACSQPTDGSWTTTGGDCDDTKSAVSPSGNEGTACMDGNDNDCDQLFDGNDPDCQL